MSESKRKESALVLCHTLQTETYSVVTMSSEPPASLCWLSFSFVCQYKQGQAFTVAEDSVDCLILSYCDSYISTLGVQSSSLIECDTQDWISLLTVTTLIFTMPCSSETTTSTEVICYSTVI